jgi:hypothetical protein
MGETMKKTAKASIAAAALALAMLGAGLVSAKEHGDGGPGNGNGRGHGNGQARGPHGSDPGDDDDASGGARGPKGPRGGKGNAACDPASSTIGAFVDAVCPCAGVDDGTGGTTAWRNHGQYVRCVAHAVKDATRSAGVKQQCGRGFVRCAARSNCGRRDVVSCADASCCLGSPGAAFLD